MKTIVSPDNPSIRLAQKLKQKKYRDREGLFLMEGKRSIEELLLTPERIHTLFVQQGYEEEIDFASSHKSICLLDERLMKLLADTQNPQAYAAIVKKENRSIDDLVKFPGLWVLLDRVSDPGNIGTIIRSCWAFGVQGLLLTPGSADPFNPKVVRSSMGGILHLPIVTDVDFHDLQGLQDWDFLCTDIGAKTPYYEADLRGKCILVLGNEAEGVTDEIKHQCQKLIKIPMNPQVDSLNVAMACAIIVAEAARQRR